MTTKFRQFFHCTNRFSQLFFLHFFIIFPLPLPATSGGGLRILSRKDSAIFRRNSVQLNCSEPACHGPLQPIFCSGPIIWATWQFGMQKECPGNRLRHSPQIVLQNFDNAFDGDDLRRDAFQRFCEENFDNQPYLETARIPEWKEEPKMFSRIRDPKMKFFAQQIHKIWPFLSKHFVDDVRRNPSLYPIVAVPNRFIVPSSLFQIYFYWDSYWIIRGLLLSDLLDTARGMIENFSIMIRHIGHIPNSGNIQFSRRSQPPMFTQMLFDFFLATGANSRNAEGKFVRQMMELAERELNWWRKERTVQMSRPLRRRQTRHGQMHFANDHHPYTLFRYITKTNCPRPEGFLLDFQFAINSGREDLEFFWSSTTSAAESGMDFSSRWFSIDDEDEEMAYTRKGIKTNNVLPVDLNVFMAMNYRAMAKMHSKLRNEKKAKIFEELAESLISAIDDVFRVQEGTNGGTKGNFDQNDGLWFDYDLAEHRLRKKFYPSNIFPLLLLSKEEVDEEERDGPQNGTRIAPNGIDGQRERNCERVLAYLEKIGAIGMKGGLPSSMERNSVELWDFPIAWPPTTHFAVLALLRCRNEESTRVAKKIADEFITTAYNGLFHTRRGMPSQIWDKYDARFDDGRPGFGTDYLEQIGFGWTNGVLLDFIRIFHTDLGDPEAYWRPT